MGMSDKEWKRYQRRYRGLAKQERRKIRRQVGKPKGGCLGAVAVVGAGLGGAALVALRLRGVA